MDEQSQYHGRFAEMQRQCYYYYYCGLNHTSQPLLLGFIIIIIIIIIIITTFMQGICTYIPETNYVPREYSVAAILLLLFMVLISLVSVLNLLYFYISTFRNNLTTILGHCQVIWEP